VFLSDDDDTLRLYGASGYARDVEDALRAIEISRADEPDLDALIRSPQPMFLNRENATLQLRHLLDLTQSVSVVVMPIAYGSDFFGVVTASVTRDERRLEHDEHLLERLRGMASHAATALLNARLLEQISHQATHDGLTGLANRLLFKVRTEEAADRANEQGTTTALLFVDLDGFKHVNDTHGHAAGDQLLVQVAERINHLIRPSDVLARLGGDEFSILLADVTDPAVIDSIKSRIRTRLEEPYNIDGHQVTISASIGTSIMRDDDDYESLLQRGDSAMYEVKRARRTEPRQQHLATAAAPDLGFRSAP
jgi:diguanylate cyclase (GGDEF)-like protein